MNILIVKLSAIGDVVHTLPSLAALRKLYPLAHITWVIEEAAADLIKGHPYLDRVLVSYRKRWVKEISRGKIKTLKEVFLFLRELRSRRYDLVIDFHGLLKSSLIVGLAPAGRKLGFDSMQELSGLFVREKIPEDMTKHAVDRYLDLVHHLGGKGFSRQAKGEEPAADGYRLEEMEFLIPRGEAEEEKVAGLLAANGLIRGRFVAVNPAALWETKLWEDEGFAGLCDRITGELGLPVVFTGADKKEGRRIQALMSLSSINLAGETSLRELSSLYWQAAAVVTTDTGPMHIAAASGAPVVALFGPTDPARTGPYGPGHLVLRLGIACSPCFRRKCSTRACMRGIEIEAVFQAVRTLLQDRPSLHETIAADGSGDNNL